MGSQATSRETRTPGTKPLHHDVLWKRCYAFHGLHGRHGRDGRHEFDGWRLQHGRHDEQDDVKHGLDADGVFIIEDVILISFFLLLLVLLLLDDEQQHVLDAWRRQRRDVSASNAWNGDAGVPLHARHDHRGDALSSFNPGTCLRDPPHRHRELTRWEPARTTRRPQPPTRTPRSCCSTTQTKSPSSSTAGP